MNAKAFTRVKPTSIASIAVLIALLVLSSQVPIAGAVPPAPALLDPTTIPKYVNQLAGPPPVYVPDPAGMYIVDMTEFTQQILPPPFGKTIVWGYGGQVKDALTGTPMGYSRSAPGATFEAVRGTPVIVKWVNGITGPHIFPVDPSLHWADPNGLDYHMMPPPTWNPYPPGYEKAQSPVPVIPHLHGGEVQSTSDGHPEAWFTNGNPFGGLTHGTAYNTYPGYIVADNEAVFYYPNEQPPTTLWYHDHALGITRINVMSGLAGFYLLRDPADTIAPLLPSGLYEMPLVIQDRTFKVTDPITGRNDFWFPEVGLDPTVHPYWMPEFFGNTIMVNGLVWPNLNVDNGQYRFRILDGSNARFYTLWFQVKPADPLLNPPPLPFIQIGSDGGYLQTATPLSQLTIAPGERVDILVDFSALAPGDRVILRNSAKAPFPNGAAADPQTVGQIMQFTVTGNPGFGAVITPANLPALNMYLPPGAWPTLPAPAPTTLPRRLVLWEVMGPLGPTEILLNGQKWAAGISETPKYHDIEEWVIVNPTADTHPIHLHLVQFQLVSRQSLNIGKYVAQWLLQNAGGNLATGMPPWDNDYTVIPLDPTPYLKGKPAPPAPNEMGWKDTVQVNPGEVTIIRVRFEPIDGTVYYPFDPWVGPGYVWHCHILDHEDNEMMRPYLVLPPENPPLFLFLDFTGRQKTLGRDTWLSNRLYCSCNCCLSHIKRSLSSLCHKLDPISINSTVHFPRFPQGRSHKQLDRNLWPEI